MYEGIPVAVYLQVISILIGIVAFVFPAAITIAGFYFRRQFSSRIDSVATDLDESLDRISELETKLSQATGQSENKNEVNSEKRE